MNDEIKLMLNIIKDVSEHKEGSRNGLMILSCKDYKTLLDYITNLEQENKTLHENNQAMQEEMARVWEENERLKGDNEFLKKEIIKLERKYLKCDLLNILQNGSDDE